MLQYVIEDVQNGGTQMQVLETGSFVLVTENPKTGELVATIIALTANEMTPLDIPQNEMEAHEVISKLPTKSGLPPRRVSGTKIYKVE